MKVWLMIMAIMAVFTGCSNQASSVAIIGGADGPTEMFVQRGPIITIIICVAAAVIVGAVIGIAIYLKKKKK